MSRHNLGELFTEIITKANKKIVPLLAKYIFLPESSIKTELKQEIRNLIDELVVYLQTIDKLK